MTKTGVIYGINGPIVYLKGDPGFTMNEMVYVGKENLVGEVIGLTSISNVHSHASPQDPNRTLRSTVPK